MKTIIGLGNPGTKYAGHRHNVGFQILDQLATDFAPDKYEDGDVAMYEGLCLVKPATFMNDSGKCAQKFKDDEIIVVYDDIDINLGTVK